MGEGLKRARAAARATRVQEAEWVACHDTLVCMGAKQIQKWCVREQNEKGPLVAVMLTKEVAHILAAAPAMAAEIKQCAAELGEAALLLDGHYSRTATLFRAAANRARALHAKATGERTPVVSGKD